MKTLFDLLIENDHYYEHVGKQNRTDKELRHKYCSLFYNEYFKPYQHKEITLLEVGICHGGSLLLWNEYFHHAHIIGVDNSDQTNSLLNSYERITTHFNDAYSQEFADKLPMLDIAIDDGLHTVDSQLKFIELFFPKLKKGGMLVIEDIANLTPLLEFVKNYKHSVFDNTKNVGTHDSVILAIRK